MEDAVRKLRLIVRADLQCSFDKWIGRKPVLSNALRGMVLQLRKTPSDALRLWRVFVDGQRRYDE
jgi:hypothetical protein